MNELEILVKKFNDYADSNIWNFAHGQTYFINQKENEGNAPSDNQIQLFLFEPSPLVTISNTAFEMNEFRAQFFIGMKSLPSDDYYKSNNGFVGVNYRFDKYIVPCFTELKTFIQNISFCEGFEVSVNSIDQRTNYLDHNVDGFLVTATIKVS